VSKDDVDVVNGAGTVDVVDDTAAVDAVMSAALVFAAVTAESIAQAGHGVTLPQLRVLTVAADVGTLRNSDVARVLGIHISNASRLCDRLVQAGLLNRRDSPVDRRQVELTLTQEGRRLVDAVDAHRRLVFTRVLTTLSAEERTALTQALTGLVRSGEAVLGPVVKIS
jgi:DNA-binding MarR family transcriptional regulator